MSRTYHYRYSYDPIFDDVGKPQEVELGHLDDARFYAMAPYEYLTADYIAALSGSKNPKSITHRFNDLKREPHRWIDNAEPMMAHQRRYRNSTLAYSLNAKSLKRIKNQGKQVHSVGASGGFVHKLMSNWIRASFDIATKIEGQPATIIPWHEIITNPIVPKQVRDADCPYRIPVPFTPKPVNVVPDVYPFALKTDKYALLLLETDCDSEDIENQIDLKFRKYIAMFNHRVVEDRFGFDNTYVLFVTTSNTHMHNVMGKLATLTEDRPRLRKRFIFKHHPSLESDDKPRATGHMLTEPYYRAQLPLFNLLTQKEV
jgi:hypothetical protein